MLMIITLHYCNFGYHVTRAGSIGNHTPVLWLMYALCFGAVNLYVLISGYFLCESTFKWKKVFKLVIEVLFYSVIIGVVFYVLKLHSFNSFREFLKVVLPVTSNTYWFVSTYIVLYIVSPYLNKFINTLNKKEYTKFLAIMGIVLIVFNNLVPGTNVVDITRGYGILWFMFLYLTAAYIRKFDLPKIRNLYYFMFYLILSAGTFASRYISIKYLSSIDVFKSTQGILYSYNSITVFLASVCLFMFFKNLNIKPILPRLIEKVSIATFGVYLIHENFLIRSVLYDRILKIDYFAHQAFYIKALAMMGSILGVFIICVIIDMIRKFIFDRLGI